MTLFGQLDTRWTPLSMKIDSGGTFSPLKGGPLSIVSQQRRLNMGNLEPHFPQKRLSTNTLTIPHSPRNIIEFRVGSEKDVAYGSSVMKVVSKCVPLFT